MRCQKRLALAARLNQVRDRVTNLRKLAGIQFAGLPGHEAAVSSEQLAGTRVTGQAQGTAQEVSPVNLDRAGSPRRICW